MVKNNQPLGATIRRDEVTGEIFVARVIHGGLASRSLLNPGDRLMEVNQQPVGGMSPEEIIRILASCQGTVMFKLVPKIEKPANQQATLFVQAMVDYSPQQDPAIPCAEAGIQFCRGDVLEVLDQADALWWQARKLRGAPGCAGLIPSIGQLKKQKETCWWQSFRALSWFSSCLSSAPTPPYIEVVRYQRHLQARHRLIALVPSGVGVNELRRRLIETQPKTFRGPVPTTRAPKSYEEPGQEYHFISRSQFESMVDSQFLEYGNHKGHLYGTSFDAIADVLDRGMVCVVDIDPQVLVRTQELWGYVVFVKPPSIYSLRQTRKNAQVVTSYYVNRPFKDEDFQEMVEMGRKMEAQYGHLFDCVLVNDRLLDACVELLSAVQRAQDEPQWVPALWVSPADRS
uniref:MAGUK p55 scaffold protein 4 n=1 Tax=Paramormyrops kingsleyae TaxID=1676925 RepID=A0A3B3S704_9TELE